MEIDHHNGLITTYNHLQDIAVQKGQRVGAGEVIALVGTTGSSTGCHLHFETVVNGTLVDPSAWRLLPLGKETPVLGLLLTNYAPGTGPTLTGDQPLWTRATTPAGTEAPVTEPALPVPTAPATEPALPAPTAPATEPALPAPTAPATDVPHDASLITVILCYAQA